MEENKDLNLAEKVNVIYNNLTERQKRKLSKELRIPRQAKVNKRKMRQGYIGVFRIDENGNLSPEKKQVEGMTFNTKDGTYHATDGTEILMWKGKFPVVFQPTWKRTPINFSLREGLSQTVADKYVLAKMKLDALKGKRKGGSIIIWIILGIIVIVAISYFAKGGKIPFLGGS
jgi:hypothetical protein